MQYISDYLIILMSFIILIIAFRMVLYSITGEGQLMKIKIILLQDLIRYRQSREYYFFFISPAIGRVWKIGSPDTWGKYIFMPS